MCSIPSVGQGEHHEDLNDHWFCLLCFVFKLGGDFICKQKRRGASRKETQDQAVLAAGWPACSAFPDCYEERLGARA